MQQAARRIALLCIDPAEDEGVLSLNYSTRKLMAALQSPPEPRDIEVHLVESRDKNPDEFLERLEAIDADIIGASGYVWSMPTFVEVARRWKRRRPDSLVVFGGPSARPRMFQHEPFADAPRYIDAFVEGEGEEVLRDIAAIDDCNRDGLLGIPGIMVSTGSGWRPTAPRAQRKDLADFKSPYVMGLLGPHQTGLVETFRGCPFACTFCQWGDAKKIDRTFSAEYIAGDLRALASLEAKGAALIDAGLNLNPRAFQNLLAAEREVGFFKKRNFYCEVYPSHLSGEQVEFLENVQADRISVGLQSFDPDVLETIQRRFDEANFRRVVETLSRIANLVTVEIIMGLPGDNPRSFLNTLDRLLELPCEARVFHCLVLPDALMDRAAPGSDMVYDQATLQMISCKGWPAGEIAKMREALDSRAASLGGVAMKDWWEFPGPKMGRQDQSNGFAAKEDTLPPEVLDAIARRVDRATGSAWNLSATETADGKVSVLMKTPEGTLVLDMVAAVPGGKTYRSLNGIDYSYRRRAGAEISSRALRQLDRVIEQLGGVIPPLLRHGDPAKPSS
jgi:radical SAM superfamily enzyme YgiQ (UPF0313 family)